MKVTGRIEADFLPALERRVANYAKLAEKAGQPPVKATLSPPYFKAERARIRTLVDVDVEVPEWIGIKGFTLVGSVRQLDGGNIVHGDVPHSLMESENLTCSHCGKGVKTLLVFRHVNGDMKEVGVSCAKSFIGVDGMNILRLSARKMDDFLAYEETERPKGAMDSLSFLACVATAYRLRGGFQKGGRTACDAMAIYEVFFAYGDKSPTSDFQRRALLRSQGLLSEDGDVEDAKPTDSDLDLARCAFDYFASLESPKTDFEHNVRTAVRSVVSEETRNTAAWAIPLWLTRHQAVISSEEKKRSSSHVGAIGDKVSFSVKSAKLLFSKENRFSTYENMYEFVSNEGNVFVWKTTITIDVSDVASVTGTVKEHKEYKGIAQTVLARCKTLYQRTQRSLEKLVFFFPSLR